MFAAPMRVGPIFAIASLLTSCQSENVATTIALVISAEPQVAALATQLEVEVRTSAGAPVTAETIPVSSFPVRRVIVGTPVLSPAVFSVIARNAQGEFVAAHRTVRSFVADTQVSIDVLLLDVCRGLECSSGESCVAQSGAGRCEPLRGLGQMDAGVDGSSVTDGGSDVGPDTGLVSQPACTMATCTTAGQWCNPVSLVCEVGCDERRDCPASQRCVDNQCACAEGTHLCSAGCVPNYAVATCGDRCEPCVEVGGSLGMVCIEEVCSVGDCEVGLRANADRSACVDYNECEENNGGCPTTATCVDTGGRRRCQCNDGSTGNTCPVRSPFSAISISSGSDHSCAIFSDNNIRCWGRVGVGTDSNQVLPQVVTGLDGLVPVEVSLGAAHTCARFGDGSLRCWGAGGFGRLGTGTVDGQPRPAPVQTPAGLTATSVAAGYLHTCASFSDGSAWCWGNNRDGQLGTARGGYSLVPVLVPGTGEARRVTQVAAGYAHSCALIDDGRVLCWGADWSGQLGDAISQSQPAPVFAALPEGAVATQVSIAGSTSCARLSDGNVLCWGEAGDGQAGVGTNTDQWVPAQVDLGGVSARRVVQGGAHGCALLTDDTLRCWGANATSQLGFGTQSTLSPGIVERLSGRQLAAFSLGGGFSCAIAGGSIYCWGQSTVGQLGNGGLATVPVPELSWEAVSE